MAELNDKLITYGNLSTFYDKLQEQGLGGNAIEDASVLPDASENKDKLFRLDNGDKDVYAAKLLSSETITTNRLPDEQQIDKAYLYEAGEPPYYYKGSFKVIFDDVEVNGYGWLENGIGGLDDNWWVFILTEDNAENVQSDSIAYGFLSSDGDNIDLVNKTITVGDKVSTDYKYTLNNVDGTEEILIPATYNAPESAQIGNATLIENKNHENDVYTGEQITFEYNNEQITGYKWTDLDDDTYCMATDKPASEIYFYYDEDNDVYYTDTKLWYISLADMSSEEDNFQSLYIPQLNAPDSEQVENAYLSDGPQEYKYEGDTLYMLTDDYNHTYYGYKWFNDSVNGIIFSDKKASDVYGENVNLFLASSTDEWEFIGSNVYHAPDEPISVINVGEYNTQVSTVKYQRTVTNEEWGWQPLTDNATNEDIDLMFSNEIKLIRYQDSEQQAEGYVDMWVNTSGETMEYDGQTYYKWVAWYNTSLDDISEPTEHPDFVMLTNTLNISLPFNIDSPEYEYTINYDSERDTWLGGAYFHGDYTQKTVQ